MRLFFAVQLPGEVKETLRPALEAARSVAGDSVGLSRVEQLHFTLAFIGETDRLEDAAAAAEAVRGLPQFELAIGSRGAFPNMSRPRVLWIGATDGAPALTAVAQALSGGLRERGFKLDDRPFQPHLTLGRAKANGAREARRALEALPKSTLARFTVREIALVQSVLGSAGATHTALRRFQLAPRFPL